MPGFSRKIHSAWSSAFLLPLLFLLAYQNCLVTDENPLDPSSSAYVGDISAHDHKPPVVTYDGNYRWMKTGEANLPVSGTARDTNGIAEMTIGNQTVALTGSLWTAVLPLQMGANAVVVKATDNSYHKNIFLDTLWIERTAAPTPPSQVTATSDGRFVRVGWHDNAGNESGYRVMRCKDETEWVEIGSTSANETTFVDTSSLEPGESYTYAVAAIGGTHISNQVRSQVVQYPHWGDDGTNPILTFVSPAEGDTVNRDTLDCYLSVRDSGGIQSVFINGIQASREGPLWHARVMLTPGINRVRARARDNTATANIAHDSIRIFCDPGGPDKSSPVIILRAPANYDTLAFPNVTLMLSALDPSGIAWGKADSTALIWASGSDYIATLGLTAGKNQIAIQVSDKAGNLAADTLILIHEPHRKDTIGPQISILSPSAMTRIRKDSVEAFGDAIDNSRLTSVTVNGLPALVVYPKWRRKIGLRHGLDTITVAAVDSSEWRNGSRAHVVVIQNRLPILTRPADTSMEVGDIYTDTLHAVDPDGDPIALQMVSESSLGATVFSDSIVRAYRPTRIGIDTFRVIARDAWGDADTASWIVRVLPAGTSPRPPRFTTPLDSVPKTAIASQTYSVDLDAFVPNGDAITYSLQVGPPGMTMDASSGVVRWTPSATDGGKHLVRAGASDASLLGTLEWQITVLVDTIPPRITILQPSSKARFSSYSTAVTLSGNAHDAIGISAIRYRLEGSTSGSGTAPGSRTWKTAPITLKTGKTKVIVTALDLAGNAHSDTIQIRIFSPGQTPTWMTVVGGKEEDRATDGIVVPGGYLVVGYVRPGSGMSRDHYVIRLDPLGNVVWDRRVGEPGSDHAHAVTATHDGNYVLVGNTYISPGYKVAIYKIDEEARVLWKNIYTGFNKRGHAHTVRQTKDGGYIVGGEASGDLFLMKLDAAGNILWVKTYGGDKTELQESWECLELEDGGFLIASGTTSFGAGTGDGYLVRTDSQGKTLWTKTIGTAIYEAFYSCDFAHDGGYVMCGTRYVVGGGNADLYVAKVDSLGNEIWTKTIGEGKEERGLSIKRTNDGNYIVAGRNYSKGNGKSDVYLLKLSPSGDILWEQTIGGSSLEGAYDVEVLPDGGYLVSGLTQTYGEGSSDALIIRTDANGNAPNSP